MTVKYLCKAVRQSTPKGAHVLSGVMASLVTLNGTGVTEQALMWFNIWNTECAPWLKLSRVSWKLCVRM